MLRQRSNPNLQLGPIESRATSLLLIGSLVVLTSASVTLNTGLWRQISALPRGTCGRVAALHTGLMLLEIPVALSAVFLSYSLDRENTPVLTPLFMAVPFSLHLLSAQLVRKAHRNVVPLASQTPQRRTTVAVGPTGVAVRW